MADNNMNFETIKNNRDFLRTYKNGKRAVGHLIVGYKLSAKKTSEKLKKNLGKRIGITVSKKVGKAVKRNRVRRLIRQAVYEYYDKLEDGYDYVFVARVKANGASYEMIKKNLTYVVNKLN